MRPAPVRPARYAIRYTWPRPGRPAGQEFTRWSTADAIEAARIVAYFNQRFPEITHTPARFVVLDGKRVYQEG